MNRLYSLDYLRGLVAVGIMIFHYSLWTFGEFASETFLGRLGIYGVSIFYILSGLTLYYVYHTVMVPSKADILTFAKKRFFRIYPLLGLATILTIILSRQFPDILTLAFNLTGLFGLVQWDGYYATGAWSIGNELVFYIFFPVFILLKNRSIIAFILFSLIILGVYLFFAFTILDVNQSLNEQWRNYVNPLNQVFLFLGGFLIGMIFKDIKIGKVINLLLFLCGLALLVFYPSSGDLIHLVTGVNRIIFTISCLLICLSFYKTRIKFPEILNKPLTLLGEASYSIYLLHPIVYDLGKICFSLSSRYFYIFPVSLRIISSVIVTILISYLVYLKFEKYFMKAGRSKDLISFRISFFKQ